MALLQVDPRQLLYSQCCVKPFFKDGKTVENTITGLVNGTLSPENIPIMRVCILPDGTMHSLDNRRLYAFKEAINRGSTFRTVTVERSSNLNSLKWKMNNSSSENWSQVVVKFDCRPYRNY
ncbi:unnamed protein product [Rhizophagus irregularis]|uniref:Uncharacterized protein n=4 Tax=Rhizophagus irregularis TaxID=588596 RepID=A0A2N1P4J8_9GLOM|nr:hypothetical protein RhiirC2_722974 [Rhizophagus irregularis]CAB4374231.1 unnamed protein product [Rhizophagus irregularis]CAB5317372.1 unnamed protein product [Rhizophagus irregularis]